MRSHARPLLAAVLGAVVTLASGCASTPDESTAPPEWLFTQTAQSASFVDNGDGTGVLTLTGVAPTTTAFTDRPNREAHLLSSQAFTVAWNDMFRGDPPNATLVETGSMDEPSVIELLDASLMDGGRSVAYTVKPLVIEGADKAVIPSSTAQPVALFIDATLVELLVVIGVAGTLVGLLAPAIASAESAAEAAGVVPDLPPIRVCLGAISQSEAAERAKEVAERVSVKAGVTYLVKEIVEGDVGGTCDMAFED